MQITLYNNKSDNRVLNKDITQVYELSSVILKDDTELVNPTFILNGSINTASFNYIYAPSLHRYYYVSNVTYSQQRLYITCHIDVLMSYKTYLLAKSAILSRSANKYNTYQIDNDIPQENENNITTLPFPHGFEGESLVLIVAGGENEGGE